MKRDLLILAALAVSLASPAATLTNHSPGSRIATGDVLTQIAGAGSVEICNEVVKSHTTAYDSGSSFGNVDTQRWFFWPVTNTASATICSVSIAIYRGASYTNGTISAAIYLTDDGTNALAQVGSDSTALALYGLSTTRTTNTFYWYSGKPTLGATNYLIILKPSYSGTGGLNIALHGSYNAAVAHGCSPSFVIGSIANRIPYYVLSGDVQ